MVFKFTEHFILATFWMKLFQFGKLDQKVKFFLLGNQKIKFHFRNYKLIMFFKTYTLLLFDSRNFLLFNQQNEINYKKNQNQTGKIKFQCEQIFRLFSENYHQNIYLLRSLTLKT